MKRNANAIDIIYTAPPGPQYLLANLRAGIVGRDSELDLVIVRHPLISAGQSTGSSMLDEVQLNGVIQKLTASDLEVRGQGLQQFNLPI